jgi:hypothetical protein
LPGKGAVMVVVGVKRGWAVALFVLIVLTTVLSMFVLRPPPTENENTNKSTPSIIYGDFVAWKEVDDLFPRNAYATVRDYDSGLSFRVQRRAGTYHADVQPLTAKDTAIMKSIYSGQWTWKRRAVLVILDSGQILAASMNGMPHGSGAIRGNKFNGHFCIHFRDSITHGTRSKDKAHQVMIWKAAGVVKEQLAALQVEQAIEVVFAAIAQGDIHIAEQFTQGEEEKGQLLQGIPDLAWLKLQTLTAIDELHFQACVQVIKRGRTKPRALVLNLELLQQQPHLLISARSLLPLVQ